jgi:hypothetical protein
MKRLLCCLGLLSAVLAGAAQPPKGPVLIAKPDAFETLINPQCSHCRDEAKRRAGELRDRDRVLCWTRGYSDGGAIPFRFFLSPYRVISDTYGVFVYDPDAGYARAFAASLDFRFHGWRNGVMVMKHKDGTLYSCLSGVAFQGPRKGARLRPVPALVSDWGPWLKRYPGAVAYHMFDKYQPVELPTAARPESVKSRGPADKRLPADTPVLGVADGRRRRAYPLTALKKNGLTTDTLGGRPAVVLWDGATQTAAAYRPIAFPPKKDIHSLEQALTLDFVRKGLAAAGGDDLSPRTVTLRLDRKNAAAPFADKETGSRWDVAGRAVAGKLKGWTLHWLDGTQVKWFAWAAEYPDTDVFGQGEAKE